MNERLVQAVIRFLMIGVGAFLATLGANISILKDAVDDPIFASLIESVATAAVAFLMKYAGGITQAPITTDGVRAGDRHGVERPNPLAL